MSSYLEHLIPSRDQNHRFKIFYYSLSNRLEPLVDIIFKTLIPLSFGGAVGTLAIHTIICAQSHEDIRQVCDRKLNDIIFSTCGGLIGGIGAMYIRQLQLWQRIKWVFENPE